MQTEAPVHATISSLHRLVRLGGAHELYLSLYVSTSPEEVMNGGLRAHVSGLIDHIGPEVEETPWRDVFRDLRRRVEEFAETIRPGTDSLVILSRADGDGEHQALWLPAPVADEVRFGPGAYVLPLVNVLDEFEPLLLAFVQKDQAWVALAGAGRVEEVREYEANVPGRHRRGGWSAPRYERHTLVHVDRHLEAVATDLEELVREQEVRRVFLSGPVEALSRFREMLSRPVQDLVAGEISLDSRTSPDEAVEQLWPLARKAEREEEGALVDEIIDRSEKEAGAVTGVNETLAAVSRDEVWKLAMSADINSDGRYCIGSGMLFGPMGAHDPLCVGPVRTVWLRQELPSFAMSRGIELEVVHADPMRRLNRYGGLGGLLQSPRR